MIEIPTWYPLAGLILTGLVCVLCYVAGYCKGLERLSKPTDKKRRRFGNAEDY